LQEIFNVVGHFASNVGRFASDLQMGGEIRQLSRWFTVNIASLEYCTYKGRDMVQQQLLAVASGETEGLIEGCGKVFKTV